MSLCCVFFPAEISTTLLIMRSPFGRNSERYNVYDTVAGSAVGSSCHCKSILESDSGVTEGGSGTDADGTETICDFSLSDSAVDVEDGGGLGGGGGGAAEDGFLRGDSNPRSLLVASRGATFVFTV